MIEQLAALALVIAEKEIENQQLKDALIERDARIAELESKP